MPVLSLTLPPDVSELIDAQLAGGAYGDASELVTAAVRHLALKGSDDAGRYAALRAALAEGLGQARRGDAQPYPLPELLDELNAAP